MQHDAAIGPIATELAQVAEFDTVEWLRRGAAVLEPADVNDAVGEIDLGTM